MDGLDALYATVTQAAIDRGLVVFDDVPDISKLSGAVWKGDWPGYLDLAVQARVSLLYLKEWRYDHEGMIKEVLQEETRENSLLESETTSEAEAETGSGAWLRARLREAVTSWSTYQDQVFGITGVWVKESVAHHWSRDADWYPTYRAVLDAALAEAQQVEREYRTLRSTEVARKLHDYATQLAQHPRFAEATSEEKREFMATQLFPDLDSDMHGFRTAVSIAKRAVLIYWWDVEPIERATKAERARALRAQGETIRNIAAVLKMSEAKVRAALEET